MPMDELFVINLLIYILYIDDIRNGVCTLAGNDLLPTCLDGKSIRRTCDVPFCNGKVADTIKTRF